MSGDEVAVLIVSGMLALIFWMLWYRRLVAVRRMRAPAPGRRLLAATPLLALALLYVVLETASASDVRDDRTYLAFYVVLGAAWLGLTQTLLPLLGVSTRDDVVERGNRGAAYALGGALLGIILCFAGANIGDGPGWWVVLFSAALATGALLALWATLDALTGLSDTITVDRDAAAGVRLAGYLVATGAILGRAVAGDWVSMADTVRDLVMVGWPALILLAAATLIERRTRPTADRPAPAVATFGALPALLYIAAAAVGVLVAGPAT